MKHTRRRTHLRPRPSRSQVNQQIGKLIYTRNLLQLEWLLEAAKKNRRLERLRLMHAAIIEIGDELAELEQLA